MEEINTKTENSRVIDVIGIDMTDGIENDKDKKENEKYSFLKKALRNELIFWGRVIGYEEEVQKDENGEIGAVKGIPKLFCAQVFTMRKAEITIRKILTFFSTIVFFGIFNNLIVYCLRKPVALGGIF